MAGPLTGIRVLEAGGIGPAPFCGMVLADLGVNRNLVAAVCRPQDRDAAGIVLERQRFGRA